ncbi:hypothetical protein BH09BAC1_BH09BAC1_12890 [soil metagenome]
MQSHFTNSAQPPTSEDLQTALGETFAYWLELAAFTKKAYPKATGGWHYPSEKYGWSFRINEANQALLYLLPRDGYFKVAMVFSEKGVVEIMQSTIAGHVKTIILQAKPYAEGREIRIEIKDITAVADVKQLIQMKLAD